MPFNTSIEVSLEEARALFQIVREGVRRVEEKPHRRDDVNLSRSESAVIAERVASSIMVKLGEEVFSLDPDDPRRLAAGMVDDLYDAEVPVSDSIETA
jgi:hypothetical protein